MARQLLTATVGIGYPHLIVAQRNTADKIILGREWLKPSNTHLLQVESATD